MNTETEKIKTIVSLVLAKVEILKMKYDHYTWNALTDKETRAQLEETLIEIDNNLKILRG